MVYKVTYMHLVILQNSLVLFFIQYINLSQDFTNCMVLFFLWVAHGFSFFLQIIFLRNLGAEKSAKTHGSSPQMFSCPRATQQKNSTCPSSKFPMSANRAWDFHTPAYLLILLFKICWTFMNPYLKCAMRQ